MSDSCIKTMRTTLLHKKFVRCAWHTPPHTIVNRKTGEPVSKELIKFHNLLSEGIDGMCTVCCERQKQRLRKAVTISEEERIGIRESSYRRLCLNELLREAAYTGNRTKIDFLLGEGADINAESMDGKTPLMCAIEGRQEEIVEYLKSKGATS